MEKNLVGGITFPYVKTYYYKSIESKTMGYIDRIK